VVQDKGSTDDNINPAKGYNSSSNGLGVLRTLELKPLRYSREELLLTLTEGDKHLALIKVKALRTKVKVSLKYVDEEKLHVYEFKLKEGEEISSQHLSKLEKELDARYLGAGERVVSALVNAVKDWEKLLEYAELKDVEERIRAGIRPVLELETEAGIVRVLPSDEAVLDAHGGFLDLGDCVVVTESTFAPVEVVGGEGGYEKLELIGLAVAYCREEEGLKPKEARFYLPLQRHLNIANKLVSLKSKEIVNLTYSTFPDVKTLKAVADAIADGKVLDVEWRALGEEVTRKLRNYVVFSDERLYDVVASYIVMTYFCDFFTAVPFLFFYGPTGSGKTRANLTVTYMSRRGIFVADPSEATLYRLIEATGATLGIDESALSERAKRIIAAGYKKGAVVPRAEPTKGGVVLKLFEATAPCIFSFIELPREDYLMQRIIPINMLKSRPCKEQDPLPMEFKEIREKLYYLRLTRVPEVIATIKKAAEELGRNGIWGRELEIWAPVYTAALLIGRGREVLDYILEDVARRKESELMYAEEKLVLHAIEQLFSEAPKPLVGTEKAVEFAASDLQEKIIEKLLEEANCLELEVDENGHEKLKPKNDQLCQKLLFEYTRIWSPQKIGRVLQKLGFDRYKKPIGKGKGTRRKYVMKWDDFVKIAEAYDYEPQTTEDGVGNEK
jgi:hypothetical protein